MTDVSLYRQEQQRHGHSNSFHYVSRTHFKQTPYCTLPDEQEKIYAMRPPLRNFGGHSNFEQYRELFQSLYNDPEKPIVDVMGRPVLFSQWLLDDCAHVCYGADQAYNEHEWKLERAKRIEWIGLALRNPTKIHPDVDGPHKQRYLLWLPPDAESEQDHEWFCVVAVRGNGFMKFLTAFWISRDRFYQFGNIAPRIWPPPDKTKKRGKKQ